MPTCVSGLAMMVKRMPSRRKFNAICRKKAISVQPSARARTKENTEINLRWVAKRVKTCVHLRANLNSIKLNASDRKLSRALRHTSHDQTGSRVNASFQIVTPIGQGRNFCSYVAGMFSELPQGCWNLFFF